MSAASMQGHGARAAAEARMTAAKARFSEAAKAALAGDPIAPTLAADAYRDVQEARSQLGALSEQPRDGRS